MTPSKRRRRDYSAHLADLALAAAKNDHVLAALLAAGELEDAVRHLESRALARVVSAGELEAWRTSFSSVEQRVVDEIVTNPFLEDDDKRRILDHFRDDPDEAERTSRPFMDRSRAMWLDLLRKVLLLVLPDAGRPQ